MRSYTACNAGLLILSLSIFSFYSLASGVVPDTTSVIVDQEEGETTVNVTNTDAFPVLLLTTINNIKEDSTKLLTVTPPTARLEAGKTQSVRFILTSKEPLKTERLARVVFEGIPPQQKGKNVITTTVRQNIPIVVRPAGLAKNDDPWKALTWKLTDGKLTVNNPSPYVVRLSNVVETLPENLTWTLPDAYVLPGQTRVLSPDNGKKTGMVQKVRIHPVNIWGFATKSYEAALTK